MAANASIPPLMLDDPLDNPERYEFIGGHWLKKNCVGREDHSEIESAVWLLLKPIAARLKSKVLPEWTVLHNEEKFIPDVTFSFPDWTTRDGYLVAPAFLVVETCSQGQRIQSLFDKCREHYHRIGTPYCWVLDTEQREAYECHREVQGANRKVKRLTAGLDVAVSVSELGW